MVRQGAYPYGFFVTVCKPLGLVALHLTQNGTRKYLFRRSVTNTPMAVRVAKQKKHESLRLQRHRVMARPSVSERLTIQDLQVTGYPIAASP